MRDPVDSLISFWFWRAIKLLVLGAIFSCSMFFLAIVVWFDSTDLDLLWNVTNEIWLSRGGSFLASCYIYGSLSIGYLMALVIALFLAITFKNKTDIYRRGAQIEDRRERSK